jgi:signal transduction histidine kinase
MANRSLGARSGFRALDAVRERWETGGVRVRGGWERRGSGARRGAGAVRRFVVEHQTVADGGSAAALLLFATGNLAHAHAAPSLLLVQVGLFAPLIWRRRAPRLVFCVVAMVAFVQWLIGALLPVGDFGLLVAFYTVAAYVPLGGVLGASVIMEVGVALATAKWAPHGHEIKTFVLLSGTSTAAGVIGLQIRTRRAYLASLEDRAARAEHERDQQAQLAVTAERARISREVHDIVTHSLSVMVALTDGAACTMPPGRPAEAVGKASDIGRQAIEEMRRLLGVLRDGPSVDRHPQPGLEQLDDLLTQVRAAGLPTTLTIIGSPGGLSAGVELAVYRVVQEALTNTRKHAAGATAVIRLTYGRSSVEVEILDSGPAGPDSARGVDDEVGHGITGMRERAAVYGGMVEVGPLPDGGWRVHARFELA